MCLTFFSIEKDTSSVESLRSAMITTDTADKLDELMSTFNSNEKKEKSIVKQMFSAKEVSSLNFELFWTCEGLTSIGALLICCLLYTSPSPRDKRQSRMPSSA